MRLLGFTPGCVQSYEIPYGTQCMPVVLHEQATLEKIADAAPSAILIIAVSLLAVLLVARQMLRTR